MAEVAVGQFLESYIAALDAHELGSSVLDVPAPASDTGYSIRQLVADGHYHTNLHGLYTEIKSIFGSQLSTEALGSAAYSDLFAFFRFAADLFIRECSRLLLVPPAGPENIGDNFMLMLKQTLKGIAADTEEWYGEALYAITQQDPMFTSLTGRASFDARETTELGAVHPTKILPYTNSAPEPYLGLVSTMQTRFPHPALPPSTILNGFTHPASTPVTYARWRDVGLSNSFAPSHDNGGSVVSADEASLYYYHTQKERLQPQSEGSEETPNTEANAEYSTNNGDSDDQMDISNSGENSPDGSGSVATSLREQSESAAETPNQQQTQASAPLPLPPIDLVNVLGWTPASFVDDDEIEAAEQGTEIALVSKLILQLQALQRRRMASSSGDLEVQDNELRLALKIQNILGRLAESDDHDELKTLKVSTKLPVRLRNYVGTLPLSEQAFPLPFPNQQPHQHLPGGPANGGPPGGGPGAGPQRLASVNSNRGRVSQRRR